MKRERGYLEARLCRSDKFPKNYYSIQSYTICFPFPSPRSSPNLHLPPRQILQHLPPRDHRCPPQSEEIQRTTKRIRISKPKHRRDPAPSILEGETRFVHLVLLHCTPFKMMHRALRVDFGFILSRHVSELGAADDVEIVVSGVTAGVPTRSV